MVSGTTSLSVWRGCVLAKNALQDGTGTKEQAVGSRAGMPPKAGVAREGLTEGESFGL